MARRLWAQCLHASASGFECSDREQTSSPLQMGAAPVPELRQIRIRPRRLGLAGNLSLRLSWASVTELPLAASYLVCLSAQ
jgi:hypothetical protein